MRFTKYTWAPGLCTVDTLIKAIIKALLDIKAESNSTPSQICRNIERNDILV